MKKLIIFICTAVLTVALVSAAPFMVNADDALPQYASIMPHIDQPTPPDVERDE